MTPKMMPKTTIARENPTIRAAAKPRRLQRAFRTTASKRRYEKLTFSENELAYAAYHIRKLRWAILFAQAEPEFFPDDYDEDSGQIEPQPNREPGHRVQFLAMEAMQRRITARMLWKAGWTYATLFANWETMLSRLPAA